MGRKARHLSKGEPCREQGDGPVVLECRRGRREGSRMTGTIGRRWSLSEGGDYVETQDQRARHSRTVGVLLIRNSLADIHLQPFADNLAGIFYPPPETSWGSRW